MTQDKIKVFLAYDPKDRKQADRFIARWATSEGVFVPVLKGQPGDANLLEGKGPKAIQDAMRREYLGDSTVTIVLVGTCTHSLSEIDLKLKFSLEGGSGPPSGVVGILLRSLKGTAYLPDRIQDNWNLSHSGCYIRCHSEPESADKLSHWIEDAERARTKRAKLIRNERELMSSNSKCKVCKQVH